MSRVILGQTIATSPSTIPGEPHLVRSLAADFGLRPGEPCYAEFINYYVAVKTWPVVVLVGPRDSGKEALACRVARFLTGGSPERSQQLTGHPWWANGQTSAIAHAQWNQIKLDALTEEAALPENRLRPFFACLLNISMAELDDLAGGALWPYPVFPPNLFITATLNASRPLSPDPGLPEVVAALWWPHQWPASTDEPAAPSLDARAERVFARAPVRSLPTARRRLRRLLNDMLQPTQALLEVHDLLEEGGVPLPSTVNNEVMRYLANTWSAEGVGLFHPRPGNNLRFALDFALAQIILPHAVPALSGDPALRERLDSYLGLRFPHSTQLLAAL